MHAPYVCSSRDIKKTKEWRIARLLACAQRRCCNIICVSFQILSFHVLPTTHSYFLSSPVSLWAPFLPPLPCRFLSLTHTLFPFQQSVPVQILSDFLSAAQHFSAALFHCSPHLQFFIAAAGGAIELHFPGRRSPRFICM